MKAFSSLPGLRAVQRKGPVYLMPGWRWRHDDNLAANQLHDQFAATRRDHVEVHQTPDSLLIVSSFSRELRELPNSKAK